MQVVIYRYDSDDEGTPGMLYARGLQLHTLELPDRGNAPNFGCVLPGDYTLTKYLSQRFGWCWRLNDAHGRTAVLIHALNWAGDTKLGYQTQSHGCIGPGLRCGTLQGQKAVLASRLALGEINRVLGDGPHDLKIMKGY